jgi:predicted dehydrogenase
MNNKVVKLGVVGLGRGKNVSIELINEKNVALSAICDKNPELLENKPEEVFEDID